MPARPGARRTVALSRPCRASSAPPKPSSSTSVSLLVTDALILPHTAEEPLGGGERPGRGILTNSSARLVAGLRISCRAIWASHSSGDANISPLRASDARAAAPGALDDLFEPFLHSDHCIRLYLANRTGKRPKLSTPSLLEGLASKCLGKFPLYRCAESGNERVGLSPLDHRRNVPR